MCKTSYYIQNKELQAMNKDSNEVIFNAIEREAQQERISLEIEISAKKLQNYRVQQEIDQAWANKMQRYIDQEKGK